MVFYVILISTMYIHVHVYVDKKMSENTERQSKMNNPQKLESNWQHRVHKTKTNNLTKQKQIQSVKIHL